jgi:cytochrome c-type biogenesis protein CcmH/NrfG
VAGWRMMSAVFFRTFNEAIQLSPNNATGYLWLSKAFFKGSDYMKALQSVKNAIQIDHRSYQHKRTVLFYGVNE